MIPPEIRALMNAYTEVTGLHLTLSYERQRTLSDIANRSIQPEDIVAVLSEIKRLIRTGVKGYCDASLDWRNCMANVDTLEERVLRLRQRKLRMSRKSPDPVATTRDTGNGTIRILSDPEPSTNVNLADVKAGFASLTQNIKKAS